RLEHHGVARGQGGSNLPGEHEQREVPWDDLPAHAYALVTSELAVQQLRPAGVVIEVPRRQRHVQIARLADRLAVVERLYYRQQPGVLLYVARQRVQVACAAVRP